jgi:hypothetical protein
METRPTEEQPRPVDDQPRPNVLVLLTAITMFLAGGFNLLLGEWLSATFFITGGFIFLKGREIERLPKAARYLVTLALALLAVAMFVKLIFQLKAHM